MLDAVEVDSCKSIVLFVPFSLATILVTKGSRSPLLAWATDVCVASDLSVASSVDVVVGQYCADGLSGIPLADPA